MMKHGPLQFTGSFCGGAPSSEVLGWSLRYAEEAERSGWDEVWTTEPHFTTVV